MRIGKMDRQITIQQVTETQSSSGEAAKTWSALATVWAGVDIESGDEGTEAAGLQSRSNCLFTLRYRTDLTTKHRISYAGTIYDIVSIAEIERRQGLEVRGVAKVL